MQVEIERAFESAKISVATPKELLAEPYRENEDAYELAVALHGRAWSEVPISTLFRNREMLFALTPEAYRAYVPAYLAAAVGNDEMFGADISEYLLFTLSNKELTPPKVAVLDPAQREVVRKVVERLKEKFEMKDADAALKLLA